MHSQLTLFSLEGGKSYLIKTPTNSASRTITLTGLPTLRKSAWLGNSFNFVGFPVNPIAPPTFQSFFQPSPAHATSLVYRLSASGQWLPVSTSSTTMQSGEAFWIYTTGESDYAGPLQITLEQSTGLDYGRVLTDQTLRIRNLAAASKSIVVKQLVSAPPPAGPFPALAGEVPLSYWKMNFSSNQFWVAFGGQVTNTSLQSTQDWPLRFQVRRPDMKAYTGPVGSYGALYESVLEISDTANSLRYRIPVTAQSSQTSGSQFGIPGLASRPSAKPDGPPAYHLAGLWVGSASITNVSQPSNSDPSTPFAAGSEFQMRLIFHVDASGNAKLLQRVFQLWKNGTYTNDAHGLASVDQPGHYVLVDDEKYLGNFTGATVKDGALVGRRYSSAAFGFDNAITNLINGSFGTNLWSCRVVNGYDDATNPFKHKYHPDHNNLDEDYQTKLGEGIESFTVTRDLTLQFTPSDPEGLALAGWGDTQIGGLYSEKLSGLHRSDIYVSGTFRLRHASTVAVLNQ
jgi:hypothetical protein